MKAIQIAQTGGASVLEYSDVEQTTPGEDEVLVKVIASGVNYADVGVRLGMLPTPPLPVIPGLEYSGTIESVGSEVSSFQRGDRVVVQAYKNAFEIGHVAGGYAELAVAKSDMVVPLPDNVDFDIAAATFANYLNAHFLLHEQGRIEPGQTVLLYGAAGGVGTAVIQLAKLSDVNVIGLVSSKARADFIDEQGARAAINYKTEDVAEQVKSLTGGKGVDLILNSAGGDTFRRDFELLGTMGQVIWFGMAAGAPTDNLTEIMADFSNFGAAKSICTSAMPAIAAAKPTVWTKVNGLITQYLSEGSIKPHIHERIPLSEAIHAHKLLESSAVMGKLLLEP